MGGTKGEKDEATVIFGFVENYWTLTGSIDEVKSDWPEGNPNEEKIHKE